MVVHKKFRKERENCISNIKEKYLRLSEEIRAENTRPEVKREKARKSYQRRKKKQSKRKSEKI
jgi:hypothetical protein